MNHDMSFPRIAHIFYLKAEGRHDTANETPLPIWQRGFISGEVSEMMLGVGGRLHGYGVVGACIGMLDDGHRIV